MRVGSHPDKSETDLNIQLFYHRIILIVYIPEVGGYFKDARKILETSIKSIKATIHNKAAITVINNGSCDEITNFLESLAKRKVLDKLVWYPTNKGKIDPLIAEVRSSYETLITISDFDVLFKSNWISEVEAIFSKIPSCGMVGHLPDPVKYKGFNSATLLSGLFSGRLKQVKQDFKNELSIFAQSINTTYEKYGKENILTYTKNGLETVVGAHHFSATMRRDYIWHVDTKPSLKKMAGNSEYHYVDKPVDRMGCLRLSPRYPVVYHMANTWESWMDAELERIQNGNKSIETSNMPPLKKSKIAVIPYVLRVKLESLFFRTSLEKLIQKMFF